MTSNIRVRFAPSPTGEPHIGSLWTAQFNWLFARQHGGAFILRLEDTDQQRLVVGADKAIAEALAWYDLVPDEGPEQGGDYGPYIQSQRVAIYRQHVHTLVEQGSAYYCFCTPQRLAELRRQQQAAKLPPRYDKRCATIPPGQALERVKGGEGAVIRMNIPTQGEIIHRDIIRGTVKFSLGLLDDSILMKSDGFPTYHLANVVDDHLMKISHVIRAEEWLPSVPKHLLLYRAFDWTPPLFAHLPLLLGTDKSKLSKRHGAASALSFRDLGYLSEAMGNFLALMGWHPKGDEEVMTRQELLTQFRLEQINPSGAVFDQRKLDWLNGRYIRQLEPEVLLDRIRPWWHMPAGEYSREWLSRALRLVQDRLVRLSEIDELVNFMFASAWDEQRSKASLSFSDAEQRGVQWLSAWLQQQPHPWEARELHQRGLTAITQAGLKNKDVLAPARLMLSLHQASPDVFDMICLLGPDETFRRWEKMLAGQPG